MAVGFALLMPFALLVSGQAPADTLPTVSIALDSYSFSPNPIRLAAGRPARLHFVNRSGKGHNFVAKRFFASSRILAGTPSGGTVDLEGGASQTVDLIPAAGSYEVHCGHFLHKQLGMKARIIVQ